MELEAKNNLTNVRVEKIGLCDRPAVPDATHVVAKNQEGGTGNSPAGLPGSANSDEGFIQKAESVVARLADIFKTLRNKPDETSSKQETVDMDLAQATIEDIQKSNPALLDAIVAKTIESLKEKDGKRVGKDNVAGTVKDKDGVRVQDASVAGVTDAATDKTISTTKGPLAEQNNGGFDPACLAKSLENIEKGLGAMAATLQSMADGAKKRVEDNAASDIGKIDTSRPGEAEEAARQKAAVAAQQKDADKSIAANGNGGTQVGKIDTSRPGEAAINSRVESAVGATQRAVDAAAKDGDSGIGAIETGDPDKKKDAALAAEIGTVQSQVAELKKSLPADTAGRLTNIEKALAKLLREPVVVVGKTDAAPVVQQPVAKTVGAGSRQAGNITADDAGGAQPVRKNKVSFAGTFGTIAAAQSVRG